MDHLMQLQGQNWLSFSAEASDQGKSIVTVPQLPRLWAESRLQVAHKGSVFHRKWKGWPHRPLHKSWGNTAQLATFCHVLLLIKRVLKSQCLFLDLHTLPKASLLPWVWVQEGQYSSETQPDAQQSSSNPEHQLITESISIVQKYFYFHSSLWNQLDSSPKTNNRMSHLKLFFRWVFKDWVAIQSLLPCCNTACPCDNMPGNPRELSQKTKGMNAKQAELFRFSPPPARAWTCWQQGGMKMVLSPTNLLDKQDCALHQKSLLVTSVNIFLACHSWQS